VTVLAQRAQIQDQPSTVQAELALARQQAGGGAGPPAVAPAPEQPKKHPGKEKKGKAG
jgi:hypothetical protein